MNNNSQHPSPSVFSPLSEDRCQQINGGYWARYPHQGTYGGNGQSPVEDQHISTDIFRSQTISNSTHFSHRNAANNLDSILLA